MYLLSLVSQFLYPLSALRHRLEHALQRNLMPYSRRCHLVELIGRPLNEDENFASTRLYLFDEPHRQSGSIGLEHKGSHLEVETTS